jgi:hypothetical protein
MYVLFKITRLLKLYQKCLNQNHSFNFTLKIESEDISRSIPYAKSKRK